MNINVVIVNNPTNNNTVNNPNGEDGCQKSCACGCILWIFMMFILSCAGVLN
jgi:hypothetical protein